MTAIIGRAKIADTMAPPDFTPALDELEDGTRLILDPRPADPFTTVALSFPGAKHDARDGTTHLLEHLVETSPFGPYASGKEFLRAVERTRGGDVEASTEFEQVSFLERAMNRHAADLVGLIRQQFATVAPDALDLRREARNCTHELLLDLGDPSRRASDLFDEELFRGTPYTGSLIGGAQDLHTRTPAELRAGIDRIRTLPRTLVVSGGFEMQAVRDALASFSIGGRPVPVDEPSFPELPRGPVLRIERQRSLPYVAAVLGWRTIERQHPDAYALYLLETWLADGLSSALAERLVYDRALSYSVHGSHFTLSGMPGAFYIEFAVQPKRVEEAGREVADVLAELCAEPLTPEQLEEARTRTASQWLMRHATDDLRSARWYAHQGVLYPEDVRSVARFQEYLEAVTPEDVQRVANDVFVPERFIGVLVGRVGAKARLRALTEPRP